MGADGATSREGAAESRRWSRRRGWQREGWSTYCKYLPLTCHKVFSASRNFVNVKRARGLADITVHNCTRSAQHVKTFVGAVSFTNFLVYKNLRNVIFFTACGYFCDTSFVLL